MVCGHYYQRSQRRVSSVFVIMGICDRLSAAYYADTHFLQRTLYPAIAAYCPPAQQTWMKPAPRRFSVVPTSSGNQRRVVLASCQPAAAPSAASFQRRASPSANIPSAVPTPSGPQRRASPPAATRAPPRPASVSAVTERSPPTCAALPHWHPVGTASPPRYSVYREPAA